MKEKNPNASEAKEEVKLADNKNEKKVRTIIHNYLWYLIIFSIVGLIIETLFCFITTGHWESRKGLILGPLCPIYGVGAVAIIAVLGRYKDHKLKLFVYGTILGGLLEYIISFLLESIYGARFWDYSWLRWNLNGRICLRYSAYWGILSLIVINFLKKYIDKIVNIIKGKPRIVVDIILTTVLILDIIFTIWGISVYKRRAKETLEGKNYITNNTAIQKFENTVFSNEIMSSIFPNLQIVDNEGNLVFITSINNK